MISYMYNTIISREVCIDIYHDIIYDIIIVLHVWKQELMI